METDAEKVTENMAVTTTRVNNFIRTTTVMLSAAGTTNTRVIFRQGLPREIDCPLDWKSSLRGAARFRQGFRNDSNPVPKILSGGYLHRLLIARTF